MAYCVKCGSEIPANSKFCSACGAPADGPAPQYTNVAQPTQAPQYTNVAQPTQAPQYTNMGQPAPGQGYNQGYNYQYPMAPEGKALGICSIVFSPFIPLVGFVCGLVGLITYKEQSNKTLAIIGFILSIVFFFLYLVIVLS